MITAILALFTTAASIGQAAPELVQPFKSVEDCAVIAAKYNDQHREQLIKDGAGFVCLIVKYPHI